MNPCLLLVFNGYTAFHRTLGNLLEHTHMKSDFSLSNKHQLSLIPQPGVGPWKPCHYVLTQKAYLFFMYECKSHACPEGTISLKFLLQCF